ncbi:MAG: hypothetical protein KatS3mg005_1292 [Bryobacteraceae bacterium]|nr:MAG: hypothetical protein KatS3mg005_1292 [Bryobacteraceae bacterium]
MRWLTAGAFVVAMAWGQVEGVRSGVMFDAPRRAVRVIEGVAGAAHLGAEVLGGVEAAWVSPSGKAAVVRGSGGWALVRGLGSERVEERSLERDVEQAAWSARGRYVAVAGGGAIEVWDVEGQERVALVDAGEGREAASVAVSDEGELAVAWFDGEETALEAWRLGNWQELARVKGRGVAGVLGSRLALAGESEVVLVEGDQEKWRAAMDGRGAPMGVALTDDEVVAAYLGALAIWLAEGGEARVLDLETGADRLERLGGGEGFLLRARGREGEEIWVAVRRGGDWKAYFVPAGE